MMEAYDRELKDVLSSDKALDELKALAESTRLGMKPKLSNIKISRRSLVSFERSIKRFLR